MKLARLWNSPTRRAILLQTLLVAVVVTAVWYFVSNAIANLNRSGMSFGFDFLGDRSSFDLGANALGFQPGDTVAKAFATGIVNTLLVSIAAVVAATALGVMVGISRLSTNPLVAGLARFYVEIIRNIPLLLQVLLWHAVITRAFPAPRMSLRPVMGVFISNRGLYAPSVTLSIEIWLGLLGMIIALFVWSVLIGRFDDAWHRRAAKWRIAYLALALMSPWVVVACCGNLRLDVEFPNLRGFNFVGGTSVSPEYLAVFLGLTVYTGAFIAETVRSGILSVDRGQREAATSLGLKPGAINRLIVLPQALRVIVPPMASQYLSMVKNSSLAVAVGYPEAIRVATIVTSETGRAIEVIFIVMAIYLTFSLTISTLMNLYNRSLPARS